MSMWRSTTAQYRNILLSGVLLVFGTLPVLYGDGEVEPTPASSVTYPEIDYPDVFSPPSSMPDAVMGYELLGKVTADGISFNYMNNYMMMQQINEHLRNVPLATYHGEDEGTEGGANYPYSTGGMDTAPYGPGYAPAYEQTIYNNGYNGPYSAIAPSVFRGQAEYGDPGTLIYSFWGAFTGGGGKVEKRENDFGYDTEQAGGMIGLDLFCSSDCRSGLFYAYQQGKIKGLDYQFGWGNSVKDQSVINVDESAESQQEAFRKVYSYDADYANGQYHATLKTDNHLIGIYHQFGDEFVYNMATLRGGYNRVETTETLSNSGTTKGTEQKSYTTDYQKEGETVWINDGEATAINSSSSYSDSLSNKYNEYLGGISFERGANFRLAPFTITPRGALDYTYLYRDKSTASGTLNAVKDKVTGSETSTYELKKGSYNSIRSNVGANLSLDLYPGEQHFKVALRGGWVHEFLNDIFGSTETAYTVNSLGTYYGRVNGNSFGRDWAELGAGVEWTIVPSFMIFANYDGLFNKYLSQSFGNVGLSVMW